MNQYDLSIIIPHYNSPDRLEILLESIVREAPGSVEIIVVDDKSDCYLDEYCKCKKRYQKRVRFLENTTAIKSAGTSRNIGLQTARGTWVWFVDADDYLLDDWYANVSKYWDLDYEMVFFVPICIDLSTGLPGSKVNHIIEILADYINKGGERAELRIRYETYEPWVKIIRKEFITRNDIQFSEIIVSNDILFSTKCGYFVKKFTVDDSNVYCATKGEHTLTTLMDKESFYIRKCESIERYKWLKKRLTKEQLKITRIYAEPFSAIVISIRRGYRVSFIWNLIKLYKKSGLRIFSFDAGRWLVKTIMRKLRC